MRSGNEGIRRVARAFGIVLEQRYPQGSLPSSAGSGRHALWIDNGVPIHISYSGSRAPVINREWVESLILSSATGGVHLSEEPPEQEDG